MNAAWGQACLLLDALVQDSTMWCSYISIHFQVAKVLLIEELLHQLIQRSFHFWYYIIYITNRSNIASCLFTIQPRFAFPNLWRKTMRFEHLTAWLPPIRLKKRRPCFFWSAKTPYIPTVPRAEKAFLDQGVLLFFFHIFLLVFQKLGETTTPKDVAQHRNGENIRTSPQKNSHHFFW